MKYQCDHCGKQFEADDEQKMEGLKIVHSVYCDEYELEE